MTNFQNLLVPAQSHLTTLGHRAVVRVVLRSLDCDGVEAEGVLPLLWAAKEWGEKEVGSPKWKEGLWEVLGKLEELDFGENGGPEADLLAHIQELLKRL